MICTATRTIGRRTYSCDLPVRGHNPHDYHVASGQCAWQGERVWIANDLLRWRYPRLLAAIQYAILGTKSEAASAIEGFVNGYGGSEAVQHYGGPLEAIRGALRCRHAIRQFYPEFLSRYTVDRKDFTCSM